MKAFFKILLYPFLKSGRKIKRIISDIYEGAANSRPAGAPPPARKGWSIVVTTDGKSTAYLKTMVASLSSELDPAQAEIIVVAPPGYAPDLASALPLAFLPFKELGISPGWITRKKNLGVARAAFENVVVTHDYIEFLPGWKRGFDGFGEDFDVCMNRILFLDGRRTRDWMAWDYPGTGPGLLPYEAECTRYQYISGTYFAVKRDFYLAHPLDERLRWGEGEDVEWSLRIRTGAKYRMNTLSTVRFSKPKPADDAPYCGSWIVNTEKLTGIFAPT